MVLTLTLTLTLKAHFGDLDELVNDVGSLLGRRLLENHALDPLGKAVEQLDGPLQRQVVVNVALDCVRFVVVELETRPRNRSQKRPKPSG